VDQDGVGAHRHRTVAGGLHGDPKAAVRREAHDLGDVARGGGEDDGRRPHRHREVPRQRAVVHALPWQCHGSSDVGAQFSHVGVDLGHGVGAHRAVLSSGMI